jgi:hypothetical protein
MFIDRENAARDQIMGILVDVKLTTFLVLLIFSIIIVKVLFTIASILGPLFILSHYKNTFFR